MPSVWEVSENFDLYDDALPVLEQLRARGLRLGLVSNGGREIAGFVVHHATAVGCAIASRAHGWIKPHESIFRAALELLDVDAGETVMVGDSVGDERAGDG